MKLATLKTKSVQIVAAALLATIVTFAPLAVTIFAGADVVPSAMAGRPQTGPGEI